MRATVHVTGDWVPDTGQYCVLCGECLKTGLGARAWRPGTTIDLGFPTGVKLLVIGKTKIDLDAYPEAVEWHPNAMECSEDDESTVEEY